MSFSNMLKRSYRPLRAATGYVAWVVAVSMVLLLIVAILARIPPKNILFLFLEVLVDSLFFVAIFISSLLLIFVPFYLFLITLARFRARSVFHFVLGGCLLGAMLIAGLLATGSIISVSGSGFWRAPPWMWAVFSAGAGLSGFVFWVADIWPDPSRWLGHH